LRNTSASMAIRHPQSRGDSQQVNAIFLVLVPQRSRKWSYFQNYVFAVLLFPLGPLGPLGLGNDKSPNRIAAQSRCIFAQRGESMRGEKCWTEAVPWSRGPSGPKYH
jgi:hypothetical protein